MAKKQKWPIPAWQSRRADGYKTSIEDHYTPIYDTMRESDAYRALSSRQRALLLECMNEYRGPNYLTDPQKEHPGEKQAQGPDTFFMNWAKAKKIGIHTNRKQFYDDIKALMAHGFIIVRWKENRRKTVYAFCCQWKQWTTESPPITPAAGLPATPGNI